MYLQWDKLIIKDSCITDAIILHLILKQCVLQVKEIGFGTQFQ